MALGDGSKVRRQGQRQIISRYERSIALRDRGLRQAPSAKIHHCLRRPLTHKRSVKTAHCGLDQLRIWITGYEFQSLSTTICEYRSPNICSFDLIDALPERTASNWAIKEPSASDRFNLTEGGSVALRRNAEASRLAGASKLTCSCTVARLRLAAYDHLTSFRRRRMNDRLCRKMT